MAEDILAELRAREVEMEALINSARHSAAAVREAALRSARELKETRRAGLVVELAKASEARMKEVADEARRIEQDGAVTAQGLKDKAEGRFERAVQEVMGFITGPAGGKR